MADMKQKKRFYADLKAIGFASYADYLKSPLWLSIRARAMQQRGPMCKRCLHRQATEIHHADYRRQVLDGKVITALWPVCNACHAEMHYPGATLKQANLMIPEIAKPVAHRKASRAAKGGTKARKKAAKLERIKRLGCNPRAFGYR
jgi:hypothetical protein